MSLTIKLVRASNFGQELEFELKSMVPGAAQVKVVCTFAKTDTAEESEVLFSIEGVGIRVPLSMHWTEAAAVSLYKAFQTKAKLTNAELNIVHRHILSLTTQGSLVLGETAELPSTPVEESTAVSEKACLDGGGKTYSLGELLAMKLKISAHYNLMQGEVCTAAIIEKLNQHIEHIKSVLTTQIKEGIYPKFVIEGNGGASAASMYQDFDLKNFGSRMHHKVKYYPVWESLISWAKSQGLVLSFAGDCISDREDTITKRLIITASPAESVNIKDLKVEELFTLYEEGRKRIA